MRFHSELCHIDSTRCIVGVSAWNGDKPLGSTLGEASNSVDAEKQAISRLKERLCTYSSTSEDYEEKVRLKMNKINVKDENLDNTEQINVNHIGKTEKNYNINNILPITSDNNPKDWSSELAAIDLELNRLNWCKDDEKNLIYKLFSHDQRQKILDYKELILYLDILRSLKKGQSSKNIDLKANRNYLVHKTNKSIVLLNWTQDKAKASLYDKYGCQSRNELTEEKLYEYSKYLESIISNT